MTYSLKPSSASTARVIADIPKLTVTFDHSALQQASYLVNQCKLGEVQWMHQLKRSENDKGDINIHIYNIWVPHQEVDEVSVDTDSQGLVKLYDEWEALHTLDNGEIDDDAVNEIVNSLGVWAHSHVDMKCFPSGTDEATFAERVADAVGTASADLPQVMLIMNRKDEYYIRVVDPISNCVYENVQVTPYNDAAMFAYVQDALKNKVKSPPKKAFPQFTHYSARNFNTNWSKGKNKNPTRGSSQQSWTPHQSQKSTTHSKSTTAKPNLLSKVVTATAPVDGTGTGTDSNLFSLSDIKNIAGCLKGLSTTATRQVRLSSAQGIVDAIADYVGDICPEDDDLGETMVWSYLHFILSTKKEEGELVRGYKYAHNSLPTRRATVKYWLANFYTEEISPELFTKYMELAIEMDWSSSVDHPEILKQLI